MITRDKIHEVILMSAGWIQYSELMSTHECSSPLSNTLDLYKPNPWQSWFISISNIWPTVDGLNKLVIPEEQPSLFWKSKHAKWNTRINESNMVSNPMNINKHFYLSPYWLLIIHCFGFINFILKLKTLVVPCSKHVHYVFF